MVNEQEKTSSDNARSASRADEGKFTIVNVHTDAGTPISYITNGQNVPEDIASADCRQLARTILRVSDPSDEHPWRLQGGSGTRRVADVSHGHQRERVRARRGDPNSPRVERDAACARRECS